MSKRENDDDYDDVVAVPNENWRVIVCKDGVQWILQKRYPSQWQGQKYHRTRQGLLGAVTAICAQVESNSMQVLEALPEWVHDRQPQIDDRSQDVVFRRDIAVASGLGACIDTRLDEVAHEVVS